jgi:hypothetical protein
MIFRRQLDAIWRALLRCLVCLLPGASVTPVASNSHDRVISSHNVLVTVDFTLRSARSAADRSHGAGGSSPGGYMARFQESPGETGIRPAAWAKPSAHHVPSSSWSVRDRSPRRSVRR